MKKRKKYKFSDDDSIDDLALSVGAWMVLKRVGFDTVGQVRKRAGKEKDYSALSQLKLMSSKRLNEIKEAVEKKEE